MRRIHCEGLTSLLITSASLLILGGAQPAVAQASPSADIEPLPDLPAPASEQNANQTGQPSADEVDAQLRGRASDNEREQGGNTLHVPFSQPQESSQTEPEAKPATTKVLIMGLTSDGLRAGEVALFNNQVLAVFDGRTDLDVLAEAELRSALDYAAVREVTGCDTDESCLAQISERLSADRVVTGRIGKVGTTRQLSLTLSDGKALTSLTRIQRRAASAEELLDTVPGAVAELFGWTAASVESNYKLSSTEAFSLAVFPLDATGVNATVTRNLTETVASELKLVDGATVVGLSDVEALLDLEAERASLGCVDDNSCLAEIGGALGVDKVVTGEVGAVGSRYVIGLRVVDRESVTVERRVTEIFTGPPDQLFGAARACVRRLIGVEDNRPGTLIITASKPGSTVTVNGELLGRSPGPPIEGLAPGKHTVRVSHRGYLDFQGEIYVAPGDTTAQWVEMEETPGLIKPFIPQWVFWPMVGATALVGTAAVALFSATAWSVLDQGGRTGSISAAEWNALQTRNYTLAGLGAATTVVALVGVAVASASAVFVYWTE